MVGIVVGARMANHGNRSAASCRDDDGSATDRNSVALDVLDAAISAYSDRMPRKALAEECGVSKHTFSKMTGGEQAFGIDAFGRLPRALQVDWMQRYGREVLGVQVRELEPAELSEELIALVDRIATVRRLTGIVGKPQPAKAELREEQKRAANW